MAGQSFRFDVDFRSIDKMLAELPKAMGKAVLRKSLNKAGRVIRNEAKQNAPVGETGNLKKSMIVSTKLHGRKVKSRQGVIVFVGADHMEAPHAHLVEFGTAPREHKSGKSTGQMPANPFFRNAWDAKKDEAMKVLTKSIEEELLSAAKRLADRAEAGKTGKNINKALLK